MQRSTQIKGKVAGVLTLLPGGPWVCQKYPTLESVGY
jgi:hypothetical protein